ncbi:diacylglycerol kinase family lipid kinase [Pseudonocardia kujensis]|uniref:diacylglycerol/lipid kinase family protein n=1 Tax=Pseudonocardia kujensis TaxID=1128675 RepID=UPI001E2F47B7|nr:diacylglycerol kinase family protein [Pseudonocardia kujensis]MCE0766385.1 diacylglycerol kinase family lipid kinase [Pseudonocardia kujensis]
MRALLVVNPRATSTTPAGRDVLTHALASELKLDVLETAYRGHAAEATAAACAAGVELIVALGGDGTVNEVVNGMLVDREATGPRAPDGSDPDAPALAVVPGGSANVFARALGMPRDPVEATGAILGALERRSSRLVGLGRADDRWFTFNAGMGWDADVVAAVERARAAGREATPIRYAGTAIAEYLRQRVRPPSMTVEVPGAGPLEDIRLAFVSNTDPWTFLAGRAVRTNPGATFGAGLALFALRHLGLPTIGHTLRHILSPDGDPHGRNIVRQDAVPSIRIRSAEPLALQLDGDHLGSRTDVEFVSVPGALRVVV